ncbi:DMT family transporter [Aestuariivirga sp.]|uniref:DMT family transporter n=1 Tax=Aestuariivirga sp. TaxID=2650926 RepID=UPI00391A68E8
MAIPSHLRAILAMVVAMGVFVGTDSTMKIAMADAPLFQLMMMRGLAAMAACLTLILLMGQGAALARVFNPWLMSRGLLEVVANFSFTFALFHVPIADLTAIAQTCPLFVLLGAWFFRGERLGPIRLGLILLGILGALMVAQPGQGAASPYAVLAFLTASAAAVRDLITPNVPRGIPPLVVTFTVLLLLTLGSAGGMLALEQPVMPEARHVLLMALGGVLLVGGHFFIYIAYRIGPARSVAPFMYTLTIWAVLSGLVLFAEVPNALAVAGMALVALAGLAIIYAEGRERRAGRPASAARSSPPPAGGPAGSS